MIGLNVGRRAYHSWTPLRSPLSLREGEGSEEFQMRRVASRRAQDFIMTNHETLTVKNTFYRNTSSDRATHACPNAPGAVREGLLAIIDAVGGDPDEARR